MTQGAVGLIGQMRLSQQAWLRRAVHKCESRGSGKRRVFMQDRISCAPSRGQKMRAAFYDQQQFVTCVAKGLGDPASSSALATEGALEGV